MNTASLSRPPRRVLPWDVLLLVFQESDPSTLASLGRVSLDFLVATSSHLYGSVEISSVEALEKLFCERKQPMTLPPSRINPYLSLSQTRVLSLDFTSLHRTVPSPHLSFSQLASDPLSIQALHSSSTYYHHFPSIILNPILPHLNPVRARYDFPNRPRTESVWVYSFGRDLEEWSRIEEVELRGGILLGCRLGQSTSTLARLPPPTLNRRRIHRFHVPSLLERTNEGPEAFVKRLEERSFFHPDETQEGSIVLLVDSEEQKRAVEREIQALEVEKRRSLFVVEVEP